MKFRYYKVHWVWANDVKSVKMLPYTSSVYVVDLQMFLYPETHPQFQDILVGFVRKKALKL